ncbi:hypothetical protein EBU71_04140 [bacterium]|nr:hypothetical protein [Candidatus Elulimicrobium humile]
MNTKRFGRHLENPKVNEESFENREKMSTHREWDWQPKIKISKYTNYKTDLIGAIIFAIILVLLLTFMPKSSYSSEKPIKDEITEWYENTTISIANEITSLGNFVVNVPDKIGTGLSNFWQETKTYQIESWSKTREENPQIFDTVNKIKEYFVPTVESKKE